MHTYNTYPPILPETTEEKALDFARGYWFGEDEAEPQEIRYANYIDTIDGVGIYYDYAADYYFFTDESGE